MQHISQTFGTADPEPLVIVNEFGVDETIHPVVARWWRTIKARQAGIRDEYGIADDVECVFCEDSGRQVQRANPEHMNNIAGQPCGCLAGEQRSEQQKRETNWHKIIPARYQSFTLDSSPNESLIGQMYSWLGPDPHKTGRGLVIAGHVGRGKTGAAIGALRHYHDLGIHVAYKNVQELLDDIKGDFDLPKNRPSYEQALFKAERCRILLLDDLGAERKTDWTVSVIDQLIRKRYEEFRATIMTSNLTKGSFENYAGGRLMSRIEDSCDMIWADGPDYRAARAA